MGKHDPGESDDALHVFAIVQKHVSLLSSGTATGQRSRFWLSVHSSAVFAAALPIRYHFPTPSTREPTFAQSLAALLLVTANRGISSSSQALLSDCSLAAPAFALTQAHTHPIPSAFYKIAVISRPT